jgi:hypothetical protein
VQEVGKLLSCQDGKGVGKEDKLYGLASELLLEPYQIELRSLLEVCAESIERSPGYNSSACLEASEGAWSWASYYLGPTLSLRTG